MASTEDMRWSNCEELFEGVDFDSLYSRQLKSLAGDKNPGYPYTVLLHTGRITISLDLGRCIETLYDGPEDWRSGSMNADW